MSNAIFPTLTGVKKGGRTRTPIWKTKIQTSVSDREVRTSYGSFPRYQYSLPFEYLRANAQQQDWQTLVGFFNARNGNFDSWLYDDPDDNTVVDQVFGVGDGVTKEFRLVRSFGGFIEPIKAVNGTPIIKAGGVVAYPVVSAMIGIVTFAVAPAEGVSLTWSGKFYFRCRFLESKVEFARLMQGFWSASKIGFITIK